MSAKPGVSQSSTVAATGASASTAADSPAPAPVPVVAPAKPAKKRPHSDGTRETIESVVVAFILAFLFRTFEAEAFVIPTGSMAPTLYGQHRDVTCRQCRVRYAAGASTELDGGYLHEREQTNSAVCPNCGFPNFVLTDEAFTGDRILVNKFPYDLYNPERWDVFVFKFPPDAKTNYIKRLAGLPGEELKIVGGDVYVRKLGTNDKFRIPRKDPGKQKDLQLLVYDDSFPPYALLKAGWSERWQPDIGSVWKRDKDPTKRELRVDAEPQAGNGWQWLRYHNCVPDSAAWTAALQGNQVQASPADLLVTDFYGYNASISVGEANVDEMTAEPPYPDLNWTDGGVQWVGDLTINAHVDVQKDGGELLWELVEGQRSYRAKVDITTGKVAFSYVSFEMDPLGDELQLGEAQSTLRGVGSYDITFANVDERLCFWVNGTLVAGNFLEFNADVGDPKYAPPIQPVLPTARDVAPVGIASRGASVIVSKLKLERDIYYRDARGIGENEEYRSKSLDSLRDAPNSRGLLPFATDDEVAALDLTDLPGSRRGELSARAGFADPVAWGDQYSNAFNLRGTRVYQLDDSVRDSEDEFFALGDNSPRSKDSRMWHDDRPPAKHPHAVPRRLLIGKAFYIYWPHAIPFLNNGKGYRPDITIPGKWIGMAPLDYHWYFTNDRGGKTDYPIPYRSLPAYPQFTRMKRIR